MSTRIKVFGPPQTKAVTKENGNIDVCTQQDFIEDIEHWVRTELADVPISKIRFLDVGYDNNRGRSFWTTGIIYEKD